MLIAFHLRDPRLSLSPLFPDFICFFAATSLLLSIKLHICALATSTVIADRLFF